MSTPLLLDVAPEIDTNPTSFYRVEGLGVGLVGSAFRPLLYARAPRSPCLFTHTYFDLATPLSYCVTSFFLGVFRPAYGKNEVA